MQRSIIYLKKKTFWWSQHYGTYMKHFVPDFYIKLYMHKAARKQHNYVFTYMYLQHESWPFVPMAWKSDRNESNLHWCPPWHLWSQTHRYLGHSICMILLSDQHPWTKQNVNIVSKLYYKHQCHNNGKVITGNSVQLTGASFKYHLHKFIQVYNGRKQT